MIYITDDFYDKNATPIQKDLDTYVMSRIQNPVCGITDKKLLPMWGFYIANESGVVYKGRISYHSYSNLLLDIDNGCTIRDAQRALKRFTHYGYTSYNHGNDGEDRFRVILPLAEPMSFEQWGTTTARNILNEEFPFIDESTFYCARMFCMPAVKPKHEHLYECWKHNGELWNPNHLTEKLTEALKELEHKRASRPTINHSESFKSLTGCMLKREVMRLRELTEKVLNDLDAVNFQKRGDGVVHKTLCRLNAWMRHEGFSKDKIKQIFEPYCVDCEKEMMDIVDKLEI